MTKNRVDISDSTAISMPVRNMLAIIGAVAVGVWAYFGVLERITMLETKSVLTEKDINQHVERLELEQLQWIIITSDNAEEVFTRLEEAGIDPVLFGLTDKDFELLAKNFARIRNQLKITNDLLDKYKEYYEGDLEEKDDKK